ncbi:hypothetical protein KFL_009370020 [Klebsormidium nitens]|uniref:DUF4219 domain-containing protein n=1 Tax=Klebsormidium nitens TaxID=105231 RepID=A0A1Y1IMR8_KLENI|nr:hypothetical protein KFL_009370020 [Klebsormidium nitens]|eukprot:GAQ92170.1 hypothetical protein KFL_009370020 [Klebsormidium nitens]
MEGGNWSIWKANFQTLIEHKVLFVAIEQPESAEGRPSITASKGADDPAYSDAFVKLILVVHALRGLQKGHETLPEILEAGDDEANLDTVQSKPMQRKQALQAKSKATQAESGDFELASAYVANLRSYPCLGNSRGSSNELGRSSEVRHALRDRDRGKQKAFLARGPVKKNWETAVAKRPVRADSVVKETVKVVEVDLEESEDEIESTGEPDKTREGVGAQDPINGVHGHVSEVGRGCVEDFGASN